MLASDGRDSFLVVVLPVIAHRYVNWDIKRELGWVPEGNVTNTDEDEEEVGEKVVNHNH